MILGVGNAVGQLGPLHQKREANGFTMRAVSDSSVMRVMDSTNTVGIRSSQANQRKGAATPDPVVKIMAGRWRIKRRSASTRLRSRFGTLRTVGCAAQ